MRMTKEERKAKERQRREEWDAELSRLHRKQLERQHNPAAERRSQRNFQLLAQIHEKMRGAEFRSWYEATTGEPVDEFLERVVLDPVDFLDRYGGGHVSQFEWTQAAIERVAESNPWTNPETRSYWAEKVALATDPKERRAVLLRLATPRWASREKVMAIYQERERLSQETGIPHDVDHIVPIVHQDVCGLHCEFNLRVISAFDNRSKSNLFNGRTTRGGCSS